jgi:hypothetical protein
MSQAEPQPFYTVTDEDMIRRSLPFVPYLRLEDGRGVSFPALSRNLVIGGRAVTLPLPMIDLGDHLVAVPINIGVQAVLDNHPAYADSSTLYFGQWVLSDVRLGVSHSLVLEVENPYGPAMQSYLRRYVLQARHRGMHAAQAWAEAAYEQHDEWVRWSTRRSGSVDGTVVDEPPAERAALPAGS